jgi:Histidine kinase-, DNA gyrase B-, and HSP90-like ATPase
MRKNQQNNSIVALESFIHATRDSGYRGTPNAVAELVDNSLQAGARNITIDITEDEGAHESGLRLHVLDDGCGMDKHTLRQALRFGGSSRFDDRGGLGRYGMGLPNSSLSQARRVEVFTWQRPKQVLLGHLDVDEIASGRVAEVPAPVVSRLPAWLPSPKGKSGTLIVWRRCDRLDHRRISTLTRKLQISLGRVFRHFLWEGTRICVNGAAVEPIDPLHVKRATKSRGASVYGEPIEYSVEATSVGRQSAKIGTVTVTFSELPVLEWHDLPNEDKRRLGIANGAGVSIVRAKREIDHGWFFMGGKRRENYDDWWRCEIQFDPVLDEAFGITHTKQQIHPKEYLVQVLSPDIERMAKALNSRVRQAHLQVKSVERVRDVELLATERDKVLPPLRNARPDPRQTMLLDQLRQRHPSLRCVPTPERSEIRYHIVEERLRDTTFYWFVWKDRQLVLVLNPEHPFHRKIYAPLVEEDTPANRALRSQIDLILLAAARAEAAASGKQRQVLEWHRRLWSDHVASFLNG